MIPPKQTNQGSQYTAVHPKPPALKPMLPSTTPSETKDDPMWQDFETEWLEVFVAYQSRKIFAVTFEGYGGIIVKSYDLLNSVDRQFTIFSPGQ